MVSFAIPSIRSPTLIFRQRSGPRNYVICASHRSGSTLLCEGLRRTWHCGDPREYLSPTRSVAVFEKGEVKIDPREDFPGYLCDVLTTMRTPNGVFGLKVMWKHVRQFPRRMDLPIAMKDHRRIARSLRQTFQPAVFIWCRREDKIRQAVSLVKAKKTRLFTHQQRIGLPDKEPDEPPPFNFDEIDAAVKRFEDEEREWQTFFEAGRIDPLVFTYETFTADFVHHIEKALHHIGLDPAGLTVESPKHNQPLADETNEAWRRRYLQERGTAGTEAS